MQVTHGIERFAATPEGVTLSVGNFDGVHRGHVRLIGAAREIADRLGAGVAALTFDPHPLKVLAPERAPACLTTLEEKLALLDGLAVPRCIVVRSEPGLLGQHAEDFLASLVVHVHVRAFVEGPDFAFGRGRMGTIDTVRAHARHWGYELHVVPAVRCDELPTHPVISSSSIRQALLDGRVSDANAMLGRPYRLVGTTVAGDKRGARLGFPTANLDDIWHLIPQHAVYAAVAQLDDGRLHLAAVNVGPQPTFDQMQARVEAHLLDFEGELHGRRLGLHFLARLREQSRFGSVEELVACVRADVARVREFAPELATLRDSELLGL